MTLSPQNSLKPAQENFLHLQFGMFVHFGLYSQGMFHEWHMFYKRMSLSQYKKKFLATFDPDPEGIEQWVITAKAMGAKYLVCTSKHCDGFCLWDTQFNHALDPEYHIRNTPFFAKHKKGILDYLFEAGRKHGIRIGLYHAVVDWSWTRKPLFLPPEHGISDNVLNTRFAENLKERLVELLQIYPDLYLFWLDGFPLIKNDFDRLNYRSIYTQLRQMKPDLLIGCNSGLHRFTDYMINYPKDFLIYENYAHLGTMPPIPWPRPTMPDLPAEVCLTLNNHWGYNATDKHYKSPEAMVQLIQENVKRKGNTLLNLGPHPNGFIAQEQVDIANKIGNLLSKSNVK